MDNMPKNLTAMELEDDALDVITGGVSAYNAVAPAGFLCMSCGEYAVQYGFKGVGAEEKWQCTKSLTWCIHNSDTGTWYRKNY